ncbi:MAG: TetR family transcriptional regulator [Kiritimatiellae bacterium]|nr:TetR family transcriptional regulator [Kiritimatiellia bacterium]
MLDKGYKATTVDEVCNDAGVTKGGFFYFFKNKEDLGQQLITRFSHKNNEYLMSKVLVAGSTPLDRVYAYIDATIKISKNPENRGCLIGTFAQELHDSYPEIQATCGAIFREFISAFKKDLQAAKKVHASNKKIDTEGLASILYPRFKDLQFL